MDDYRISHLKQLEAESIHIIREVVAEFERDGVDACADAILALLRERGVLT